MMIKKMRLFHLLALSVLVLSACNLPIGGTSAEPTSGNAGLVQTAAAQTVQALQTQVAATLPATEVPASETPAESPTNTPPATAVVATNPPITLPTLTPAVVPTAIPCNKASFVADVTIPDGTSMTPGQSFTKTWRLMNAGSCAWTTDYKLVFVSGDAMGGPASQAMPATVNPGQTVDLSVSLIAPTSVKSYQGNWMLQNASGVNFGVGSGANQSFWVKIVVGGTPSLGYFAVTGVTTTNSVGTGSCPITVTFTAKITVSQAGTVTYTWKRSDGATGSTNSLVFDAAGTKSVTTTWKLGAAAGDHMTGWEQVYVDQPNHQSFGQSNFDFTCP